jgi:hypothetical protein
MAIRKPSTFPIKAVLDGSEEIYTQTNGVSEKFTVGTVASYVTQFADEWLYKEIFIDAVDTYDILANPIIILDEADLSIGEYFEINRVIIESKFNGVAMICPFDPLITYKPTRYAPLNTAEIYYKIPIDFIEAPYDSVLCFYSPFTASVFRRNHGVYLSMDSGNMGEGDTDYTIKIYYKIVS